MLTGVELPIRHPFHYIQFLRIAKNFMLIQNKLVSELGTEIVYLYDRPLENSCKLLFQIYPAKYFDQFFPL